MSVWAWAPAGAGVRGSLRAVGGARAGTAMPALRLTSAVSVSPLCWAICLVLMGLRFHVFLYREFYRTVGRGKTF